MSESLSVAKREGKGTKLARRLRVAGKIPAILYGHGEPPVSLEVSASAVGLLFRHGARVVDLAGDLTEKALIRDVQYNAFGTEILHLDLFRVRAGETLDVTVGLELRGVAPGASEGGVVELMLHDVTIRCPVISIPEKLEVNINHLHLGQAIKASELRLPEGASMLSPADLIVAHCIEPVEKLELGAGEGGGPTEPEIIGRKVAEDAADEKEKK